MNQLRLRRIISSRHQRHQPYHPPRAVHKQRLNPFELYKEDEFIRRYRFSKRGVRDLCDLLRRDLQHDTRGDPLSVEIQVLLTLRFYATGSFKKVIADLFGVSESVVCVTIHRVSRAIASHKSHYICMPRTDAEMSVVRNEFFQNFQFPSTLGAIDGCHVRIVCPSKERLFTIGKDSILLMFKLSVMLS